MQRTVDTLIVGGGPAGLAAAIALQDRALLLERQHTLGGLSTSIEIGGAIMDMGGHSFHTPHPQVHELVFNSLEMFEQTRNAQCFFQNECIPYPFQQNFARLSSRKTVAKCREGLNTVSAGREASNFEEHIYQRFGAGIASYFMLPYNRKLWGDDLRRLAVDWAAERVAPAENSQERCFTEGGVGVRKPLQAHTRVAYPARGGFGEIFTALGRSVTSFETNVSVQWIDPSERLAYTRDGRRYSYKRLISTLPLPRLMRICRGSPFDLCADVENLDALGLTLVFVVVDHPVDTDIQRLYCAEPDIAAHKITVNHTSSEYLRARPTHGIVAEISDAQPRRIGGRALERKVVADLTRVGLIKDAAAVRAVKTLPVAAAYPAPTHERAAIVRKSKDWLAAHQIWTVGRFGEWAYINSDEAIYRGLALGRALEAD